MPCCQVLQFGQRQGYYFHAIWVLWWMVSSSWMLHFWRGQFGRECRTNQKIELRSRAFSRGRSHLLLAINFQGVFLEQPTMLQCLGRRLGTCMFWKTCRIHVQHPAGSSCKCRPPHPLQPQTRYAWRAVLGSGRNQTKGLGALREVRAAIKTGIFELPSA